MNKALKKTLSIILAIIMVATMAPFAFAAEECEYIDGKFDEYVQTLSEDIYNYLCHSDNWFVKNIVLRVVQLLCTVFGVDLACECGESHMIGESLTTDVQEENPGQPAMPQPGMY